MKQSSIKKLVEKTSRSVTAESSGEEMADQAQELSSPISLKTLRTELQSYRKAVASDIKTQMESLHQEIKRDILSVREETKTDIRTLREELLQI